MEKEIRKPLKRILLAATFSAGLSACGTSGVENQPTPTWTPIIAPTQAPVPTLTPGEKLAIPIVTVTPN